MTALLDEELLGDYLDSLGIDVIKEMLNLYITQSDVYLSDIAIAQESGDQKLWEDKCHKMKGATSSAGLFDVRAYLVEIEHSTESIDIKYRYLSELRDKNNMSINCFKAWLEQNANH